MNPYRNNRYDYLTYTNSEEKKYDIYSYHTFSCPFTYEPGKVCLSELLESGEQCGEQSEKRWEPQKVNMENFIDYNRNAFLLPKARNIVLGKGGAFKSYVLRDQFFKTNDCSLELWEQDEVIKDRLTIVGIDLLINEILQIGVLSLECVYLKEDNETDEERYKSVCRINDIARRTFAPCYGEQNSQKTSPTTDRITVKMHIGDEEVDVCYKDENEDRKFLSKLILGPKGNGATFDQILDDRMHVMCILRDDKKTLGFYEAGGVLDPNIAEKLLAKLLIDRQNAEKELYEFMFVDQKDALTCPNTTLRRELLKEALYLRWNNDEVPKYSSIYGITEYSFMMVTGTGAPDYLIRNFLTEYRDIVIIGLLQRTALVRLEERASNVAQLLSKEQKTSDTDSATRSERMKEIEKLWTDYVFFQNEILLPEVSFQQQPTEMYSILKKALKTIALDDYLSNCINGLHEYATIQNGEILRGLKDQQEEQAKKQEEADARKNLYVTFIGMVLAILQVLAAFIEVVGDTTFDIIILALTLVIIIVLVIVFINYQKKKGN